MNKGMNAIHMGKFCVQGRGLIQAFWSPEGKLGQTLSSNLHYNWKIPPLIWAHLCESTEWSLNKASKRWLGSLICRTHAYCQSTTWESKVNMHMRMLPILWHAPWSSVLKTSTSDEATLAQLPHPHTHPFNDLHFRRHPICLGFTAQLRSFLHLSERLRALSFLPHDVLSSTLYKGVKTEVHGPLLISFRLLW